MLFQISSFFIDTSSYVFCPKGNLYYYFFLNRHFLGSQGRFWLAALHRNVGVREFLPKKLRRDQGGKGIGNEKPVIISQLEGNRKGMIISNVWEGNGKGMKSNQKLGCVSLGSG